MRILQFLLLVLALGCQRTVPVAIKSAVATDSVGDDPADPTIYVHPRDPSRSFIVGTNTVPAPKGALFVFGLDGKTRQTIGNLDVPNCVSIEYGLMLNGRPVDIAVVTERLERRLRVFRIEPEGILTDASSPEGLYVFEDEAGENGAPMGIGLYRRPRDGAIYAIISPKSGMSDGYLGQYLLSDDGTGKVKATMVRRFGRFGGNTEIESIAVDDALGYVYYADERDGIHKYHADPDHPDAARELAHFGRQGFRADREGIGIYARDDGTGYILCTDQLAGDSQYFIYRREGAPGNPHDHSELLKIVSGGADTSDGLQVTSAAVGPAFPNGLMVTTNRGPKNFLLFRWEEVATTGWPKLKASRK